MTFSSLNNATPIPPGQFKVWAYGESAIVPTLQAAREAELQALYWCHDPQIEHPDTQETTDV